MLFWRKSHNGKGKNSLCHALQGTNSAQNEIVKILVNHKPPTLNHIISSPIKEYRTHPNITKAVLIDDFITEDNIHRVPKQIKKVIYTTKVSTTSLNLLQEIGIKLIGPPTKMYIDEKYLGGRLPEFKRQSRVSPKPPRTIEDIYEQESKIIVKLPQLETFKERCLSTWLVPKLVFGYSIRALNFLQP